MQRLAFLIILLTATFTGLSGRTAMAETVTTAQLIEAIKAKKLDDVQKMLPNVKNLNEVYDIETALIAAAETGNTDIVQALLKAGADPNAPGARGLTPLMEAAFDGHGPAFDILLAAGASLDTEATNGYNAFDYALEGNRVEIMLKVIGLWADKLNPTDRAWLQAALNPAEKLPAADKPSFEVQSLTLVAAVLKDDAKLLDKLLAAGLNPNLHNRTGYAPLPMAVRLDRLPLMKILLDAKAYPAIGNDGEDEAIPLNQAARGGRLEAAKLLLSYGVPVNKCNVNGLTPLILAGAYEKLGIFQLLLDHGANPWPKDKRDFTAINYALQNGWKEQAQAMYLHGLADKKSALAAIAGNDAAAAKPFLKEPGFVLAATVSGADKIVGAAIEGGFDVNTTEPGNYPALLIAARFGYETLVKRLLEAGAKTDAQIATGYKTTALMEAGIDGHVGIGKMLLERGADPLKGDRYDDPALNWATFYGQIEYAKMLLAVGADPTKPSQQGYTALMTAKRQGHTELLKILEAHVASKK